MNRAILRRHAPGAAALLLAAAAFPALAQMALSPVPALVSAPPPTNLVLTIDDSGSMTSAFVPDSVGNTGINNTAAYTSSDYNRLYYNPNITYAIPPNAAGLQASYPMAATTFTAAYLDGFNPTAGTVDLSTAYTATLKYTPGATSDSPVTPTAAVGSVAYYYTYVGGNGCQTPIPWQVPPADKCFAQTVVSASSGPATATQAAGWDERQNFATWFSFYRTRHLSIASAAAIAMADPGLGSARVAWQGLTTCNSFLNSTPNCYGWDGVNPVDNRLRTFVDSATSTHRSDFYSWLFHVPAANSTPTRQAWNRAGEYFRTSGKDSPYGLDPNNNASTNAELACVNNFQITMTDGEWNTYDETTTAFCGTGVCPNVDTTAATLPDGTSYSPSATSASATSIYSDQNVGGLADIAFYYWSSNLRPDITGSASAVTPYTVDPSTTNPITGNTDPTWPYWNPRNDPATWPHMVNFTIGVGLTGYLTLPGLDWYQDSFGAIPINSGSLGNYPVHGYSNLLSFNATACTDPTNMPNKPVCNWPTISPNGAGGASSGGLQGAGSNPGNVYDLWHAAINSRGIAFSAESPKDLVGALKQILNRIEGQATGTSGAAGSTSALTTSTALYVGTYTAVDWHGTLLAFGIAPPGAPNAGAILTPPLWTTDSPGSIPPVATRRVFTSLASTPLPGSGNTAAPSGNVFNATDSSLQASPLWGLLATSAGNDAGNVVNYLLGSATDEIPNGKQYRARPISKLGDLVDSSPAYSYDENFGYQVLETPGNPEPLGSYVTYVTKTKVQAGRPAMVYVGANDGMLHAFNAATGNSALDAGSTFGVEQFAYIPHSVVPNLAQLANPNYAHRFYVDSPVYVGDAFLNGAWKTVLVGATGAGGKGVFALDVTQPQSFGAGNVLWDMDATGTAGAVTTYGNADPDLGYTIGQPTVVRLNDTHWYAAFGNGYLSTNGCPVLYLVRLDDGNIVQKLYAEGGPGVACAASNGLGSPTPLDVDGNGTTDYIYAGDLQGNLWKFDVHATNNTAWGMANLTGQTVPGRLFAATTGGATPAPQSIVGAPNLGLGPNGVMLYFSTGHFFATGDSSDTSTQSVYAVQDSGKAIPSRASLVAQTYTTDAASTYRTFSNNTVNLMGVNDGWLVDFTGGERVTQQPFLIAGVVVFVSEIPGGDVCKGGCTTFLYGINALTGGGGMDFFSANGAYYDAVISGAGCLSGLTVIIENSTTAIAYGFGPNLGSNAPTTKSPPPVGPPGGGTGTGPSNEKPIGCPPNTVCDPLNTGNHQGRISWHEMVQ
jgi:type IV pilus assembly protein PilY1